MPCHNGGNCSHTSNTGEYSCSCQTGYTGMTCETDIDECSMEPCHNNGTCIVRANSLSLCVYSPLHRMENQVALNVSVLLDGQEIYVMILLTIVNLIPV